LLTLRLQTRSKEMMVVTPKDSMQVIAIQKINSSSFAIHQTEDEFNDNL